MTTYYDDLTPLMAYVSRYSAPEVGIAIHVAGELGDPDDEVVTATLHRITPNGNHDGVIGDEDRVAERIEDGVYRIFLGPADTSTPGRMVLVWSYEVGGAEVEQEHFMEVGKAAPSYDALPDEMKALVEMVNYRFADLFDSESGRPHLTTYRQSHFGRERLTQLLGTGLRRINVVSQPHQSYTIGPPNAFPVEKWGGLLEQATYVEAIKHLIRSYTEQPLDKGVSVALLDRRDYAARWRDVLRDEQSDLDDMIDHYKIDALSMVGSAVLVGGGIFRQAGIMRSASMAARPRFYMAWH